MSADTEALDPLLEHLRTERGFDFTGYKRSSLERRIAKRMDAVDVEDHGAYLDLLQVDPGEFGQLFTTILINVTAFFRDAPVWEHLEQVVVPQLLAAIPDGPIRVWSAGCASGEETYSLAMLLAEALGDEAYAARVKIYATDVDDEALEEARAATYSPKRVEGISEERLRRFFERSANDWTFRKDLRRTIIFGRNDLVRDAPISRIDLLACRNTLMYFNAETQAQVLGRLHFALNDRGVLVLGKSEMLLTHGELFLPEDLKRRVFQKVPRPTLRDRLVAARRDGGPAGPPPGAGALLATAFDSTALAQLVVDADGILVAANERARGLLHVAPADLGRPLKDLDVSFRPFELRAPVDRVGGGGGPEVLGPVVHGPAGSGERQLEARLAPLRDAEALVGVRIDVEDVTERRRASVELAETRRELDTAYEELQATVEELETTNEELQSTNEELETTNEELQSTNEELETTNEELQSTNEELETINEELRERSTEVDAVNGFMEAILSSLHIAVVVLDRDQLVRVWNEQAVELWGVRAEEAEGRRFFDLDVGLPLDALKAPAGAAIVGSERAVVELEAVNRRGRPVRCRVRIMPLDGGVDGAGAVLLMEVVEPTDRGAGDAGG